MAEKATVGINLDIKGLLASINDAVKAIGKLTGAKPVVKVSVDDKQVDDAEKKIDDLSSTQTVKVDVDTKNVDKQIDQSTGKLSSFASGVGGAIGGFALNALSGLATGLKEGALAADNFGDSLAVAFQQQGIADVDAEIKKVSDSAVTLANNLGLPAARTKELAVNVATLGGVSGQQADDLTKLSAGLEVFTDGAVKGEAVVKAFSRGIADPEGAAAIENLTKKYPQLAEVLKSNLSPAEKLAKANLALGNSFAEVEAQQADAGGALNKISNTVDEAFANIGTQVLEALAPLANAIVPITEAIISAFEVLGPIIAGIVDNFDILGPIVLTAAAAYGAYTLAVNASALATTIATTATTAWNAVLALNPVGLVAAAVVAATAGVIALADAFNESAKEALANAEAEKKMIEGQIKSNKERTKTVEGNKTLVKEYEKLATKTKRTADEEKRLETIQRDLNKQYPDLIDATKSFGANLDGVKKIGESVNKELDNLGKQANELADRLQKSTQRVAKSSALVAVEALVDEAAPSWATLGLAITDTQKKTKAIADQFARGLQTAKTVQDVQSLEAAFTEQVEKLAIGEEDREKLYAKGSAAAQKFISFLDLVNNAQKAVNETNAEAAPPPKVVADPDKIKAAADALAKAKEELAALNNQLKKNAEITKDETIEDLRARELAKLETERKFAADSVEAERKKITDKGELGAVQQEIINKKLLLIEDQFQKDKAAIEGKYNVEELKKAQEQAAKIEEINRRLADQELARLKEKFDAGDNGIAGALLSAQRSAIERGLTATIDAIIASTPEYAAAIAKINKEIEQGLLNPADYAERTNKVRAEILARLQSLPSDTKDVYALQIRGAYQQSADEIAKGTADIVAQIRQQQVKQAGEIFADSLRGIGEALRSVDFATIYGEAADKAAALNEEQEKLIENLQDGTATYQESVDQLANLQSQQEQTASATATAISQAFQAIADQQAQAAQDGINTVNAALERRKEIAKQEIDLEKLKAAEVKALQDQGIKDKEVYEAALKAIEDKYTQDRANLKKEDEKLAQESAEVQSAALDQIAVSAGAAFASLVAGGESAGEALKKVVGSTVSALLDLYTPSIVALFSSVIPPPFGQIAGLAAVQALKALLQSALSGFEEGGYTGNGGTKQVAGVVHGQEFVMTAETTRKNRALLEHLHSGKSLESFPALQKMLADNQISTIPVTELQLMRSELSAIRQRLDSMPNGIQGNMGVDVQVGMDTYLYERDRSRMIARKLRG